LIFSASELAFFGALFISLAKVISQEQHDFTVVIVYAISLAHLLAFFYAVFNRAELYAPAALAVLEGKFKVVRLVHCFVLSVGLVDGFIISNRLRFFDYKQKIFSVFAHVNERRQEE